MQVQNFLSYLVIHLTFERLCLNFTSYDFLILFSLYTVYCNNALTIPLIHAMAITIVHHHHPKYKL